MADIDQMLRESFHRLAEPGDPTGVAEAVRARVDAGDLGTPSDSGAGFGGGASGGGWPWVMGAGAIAGIAGLALGASGFLGTPSTAQTPPTSLFSVRDTTPGLSCPDGTPVTSFHPGDRVLAVARSDDGEWLAVRNPVDRADTVWVALDELVLDEDQPEVGSLEVDGCPTYVAAPLPAALPEPRIEETEEPPASDDDREEPPPSGPSTGPTTGPAAGPTAGPTTGPEPTSGTDPTQPPAGPTGPTAPATPTAPPVDTTAPTLSNLTVSSGEVWCGSSLDVTVSATDDTAVARVELTIFGPNVPTTTVDMERGSAQDQWVHEYTAPSGPHASVDVTFQVRAFDAAENTSAARSVGAVVKCLI